MSEVPGDRLLRPLIVKVASCKARRSTRTVTHDTPAALPAIARAVLRRLRVFIVAGVLSFPAGFPNQGLWPGLSVSICLLRRLVVNRVARRREKIPIPASAIPSSAKLAGSGTGVRGAAPVSISA